MSRSSVIVLNRFGLTAMDYVGWLNNRYDVHLISDQDAEDSSVDMTEYASVKWIPNYLNNPLVEATALQIGQRNPPVRIIALSEFDLIRAARLRETLNIEGQSVQSAVSFRDKWLMKNMLTKGGIPIVDYAAVHNVVDLLNFINTIGYPIIVKPRLGTASIGIEVLRSSEDLERLLPVLSDLGSDVGANLLAEKYVPHQLVHVDGAIRHGQIEAIWPSYTSSGLGFKARQPNRSVMLEKLDKEFTPITELVATAIRVLPTPDTSLFHAEVFVTEDGLLINEIASRIGGGRIKTMWQAAFGVNLEEWIVRSELNTDADPAAKFTSNPRIGGFSLHPAHVDGILAAGPTTCPIESIYRHKLEVAVEATLTAPASNGDVIASATVAGENAEEVNSILDAWDSWISEEIVITVDTTNIRNI